MATFLCLVVVDKKVTSYPAYDQKKEYYYFALRIKVIPIDPTLVTKTVFKLTIASYILIKVKN